jgi:hypothetical protein
MSRKKQPKRKRHIGRIISATLGLIGLGLLMPPIMMSINQPMPEGSHVQTAINASNSTVQLLIDSTAYDAAKQERVIRQQIFDAALELIANAEEYIYVDMFLWNNWQGSIPEDHRALSSELADALITRKKERPAIKILALTDPINRIYGDQQPDFYARLSEAGIPVVFTDVNQMRNSNPIYSGPARYYGGLLDRIPAIQRWLDTPAWKNPFVIDGPKISRRQGFRLLNFKANHRKLLISKDKNGSHLLVTSFNPADGSSAHSNIGLLIDGPLARTVLARELDIVDWSAEQPDHILGADPQQVEALTKQLRDQSVPLPVAVTNEVNTIVEWDTEGAIRDRVISMLNNAGPGDEVRLAMFYLSDRGVVNALKDAVYGGANVRLILDPNRDAFGRTKNGIPNRTVAQELVSYAGKHNRDFAIRWADTHGEQFHTKALSVTNPQDKRYAFICGSANLTRRNLQDLNLEADVYLKGDEKITTEFNRWFDDTWQNKDGLEHTADYNKYAESGWALQWKKLVYRIQESTGLCTF